MILQQMAKVTQARRTVDQARAIRLGMAIDKDYQKGMAAANTEITRIATGRTKEEEFAQNRLALRGIFGVKGKQNG